MAGTGRRVAGETRAGGGDAPGTAPDATLELLRREAVEVWADLPVSRRGRWSRLLPWTRGEDSSADVDPDEVDAGGLTLGPRDDAAQEPCRVLLVENNVTDAHLIELALCHKPTRRHALSHVRNIADAEEVLESAHFDAVLLDLSLDEGDGTDAFVRIHAASGGAPTIVLTGIDDEELGSRLVFAGAQDTLVKGEISSALLARSIRHALERSAAKAALAQEREAALAASRAKSDFLAAMSHEIRTPLNAILGTADLLLESGLTQEQEGFVRTFLRGGESLLHVINGILDLSKVEAGQLALERVSFEVQPLVEGTVELLAHQAHKKGLALACELSPDVPRRLVGDPNRLRQVLINLLGNAVKFTETGHVLLEVGVPDAAEPRTLQFSVSDTGVGIPRDRLHAIFDPFTQADTSITRRFGGTGLGLTLSSRLVGLMGGRLWVDSEEGRGSHFHFSAHLEPAGSEAPADATRPLADARVLVAEDSDLERRVLCRQLERLGAAVEEAADGEAALVAITAAGPAGFDLILLDSRMPDLGGLQVADRLSARPELLGRVVLMFTSDRRRDDLERCRSLGIATWIEKPARPSELLRAAGRVRDGAEPGAVTPSPDEIARDAAPLSLLVVDDSEDNRQLVEALLAGLPYRLRFAAHGLAAVEACRAEHFDAVLMDIQMPRMDGFQATRVIREIEAQRDGPAARIVALTAHAFLEDRKRSLEAGCDAHLAKPIRKQELVDLVQRLCGRERFAACPDAEISQLADDYLANRRRDVEALDAAIASADLAEVARRGHDLKGTGSAYGFPEISDVGCRLETAARAGDPEAAEFAVRRFAHYLRQVEVRSADSGSTSAPAEKRTGT